MSENMVAQYSYLIVDDDQVSSGLIAAILRKHKVTRIEVANSGKTAIACIEQGTPPDIIITDLNMPEADGVEFVRHLAQREFDGGIIIISGTAKTMLYPVIRLGQALMLKMLGCLVKPFQPGDLLALIAKHEKNPFTSSEAVEN